MNIQDVFNNWSEEERKKRSRTQMTLGKMIEALENFDGGYVGAIERPHSYRGYYSDLAFECIPDGVMEIDDALAMCRSCVGEIYTGYKGGKYMMDLDTPVWIAEYGSCGMKIVGLDADDEGMWLLEEDTF